MFNFGLYTQVSDSGPHGPLVCFFFSYIYPGVGGGGGVATVLLCNCPVELPLIVSKEIICGRLT